MLSLSPMCCRFSFLEWPLVELGAGLLLFSRRLVFRGFASGQSGHQLLHDRGLALRFGLVGHRDFYPGRHSTLVGPVVLPIADVAIVIPDPETDDILR